MSRGLWKIGGVLYFSGDQELNIAIWIFLPAMFLAHVFSPIQGAHCVYEDSRLGLCLCYKWANTCVSTEEKKIRDWCL